MWCHAREVRSGRRTLEERGNGRHVTKGMVVCGKRGICFSLSFRGNSVGRDRCLFCLFCFTLFYTSFLSFFSSHSLSLSFRILHRHNNDKKKCRNAPLSLRNNKYTYTSKQTYKQPNKHKHTNKIMNKQINRRTHDIKQTNKQEIHRHEYETLKGRHRQSKHGANTENTYSHMQIQKTYIR